MAVQLDNEQFLALIARAQREGAEAERERITGDEVVANAVEALVTAGWENTPDMEPMDRNDLEHIARTVLRSVGGAS